MATPQLPTDPNQTVTLSLKDLMALVGQMAGRGMDNIGESIANAINKTQRKVVRLGEYEPKTPWQPSKKGAHKLKHVWYQNGYRIMDNKLSNVEIDLFNRIHRPGRYMNRMFEVVLRQDGSVEEFELRYKNKEPDDRFALQTIVRNMTDILNGIIDEQDKFDADEDALKEARTQMIRQGRQAFATRATVAAREAAAAKTAVTPRVAIVDPDNDLVTGDDLSTPNTSGADVVTA